MTVVKIDQVVNVTVNGSSFIGFCVTGKLGGVGRVYQDNELRVLLKSGYAGKV